jgi:hypothetical protein
MKKRQKGSSIYVEGLLRAAGDKQGTTCVFVAFGKELRSSSAAPATCGDAMEVPVWISSSRDTKCIAHVSVVEVMMCL